MQSVIDFIEPLNLAEISDDEGYRDNQLGKKIIAFQEDFPDIDNADLVIIGCNEMRGAGIHTSEQNAPNNIRKELYQLFHWHQSLQIADIGNVETGATLQDSYAALKYIISELLEKGKKVLVIGGSHDVTIAQYKAYQDLQKTIEATCIDAKIDLDMNSVFPQDNFLMDMLTNEPNFVRHYNHIGFQSYFVHPQMLETIDKLRFDCFRVGRVKEMLSEMEPPIRNSNLFSFDISAIQHANAPANLLSPNGFNGEEACTLMQYAGTSQNISSIGIYGYNPALDQHNLTAKQISQMIWYLLDGIQKGKNEPSIEDRSNFNEFTLAFAEFETTFLQSKRSGQWWMKTFDGKFTACTKNDYLIASSNDIPERWLRALERS